jgi:uncharacterized protein with HEPN domain
MREACSKVVEFTDGLTYDGFAAHGMAYHAIVRLIEVIGEAAKRIPTDVRDRHSDVEWRKISRTRDIVAHHYFAIEDETVWEIAKQHVPALLAQLDPVIAEETKRQLARE